MSNLTGPEILVIDAFTDRAFAGNPAAVCLLEQPAEEAWMAAVAAEMNLSETAFVVPEGPGRFGLRWFTPTVEVALCGHATLATTHALLTTGRAKGGAQLVFSTKSGELRARLAGGLIELDFPALPSRPTEAPAEILQVLGVAPRELRCNGPDAAGERNYLALLDSAQAVRSFQPDLSPIDHAGAPGLIVTAASDDAQHAFVSRYFVPGFGVPEDPVTGAAHCILAPFWCERLGENDLAGYQASRRGGTVRVRLAGDRVHLGGTAVTVLGGRLATAPRPH